MSKSIIFTTIVRLVLCVILVINMCIHICDYCSHICNYNVDITKWSRKCDYSLWLLHVWMEKYNGNAHFFIQYWMDYWMNENLVIFVIGHSCFGNWGPISFSFTILQRLKHMWHLWNYSICLIINLCLTIYWYFVFFIVISSIKQSYF